jgi:hypothetical protein
MEPARKSRELTKMHELAFKADFAIVKAWKDTAGNLILKELPETLIRACPSRYHHRC